MSRPAVSPFASSRLVPPPIPPRVVIPPPVVACRAIAPPLPPSLPHEPSVNFSRLLSLAGCSLLAIILLVLSGATAKSLRNSAEVLTPDVIRPDVIRPDAIKIVAENTTDEPLGEIPTASGLPLAVQSDAVVTAIDPLDLWPTDAALNAMAKSVDDKLDALPEPEEDVADELPLVDVKYIVGLVKSPQPTSDVRISKATSKPEFVSTSATEGSAGTRTAPLVNAIATDKKATSEECADGKCAMPRTLGTLIDWASTAEDAGKIASKEGKLVFLMQVSGNFARQEFT